MARWTGLDLDFPNLQCLGMFRSTGQWSRCPKGQNSNFVKPSHVVYHWIAFNVHYSNSGVSRVLVSGQGVIECKFLNSFKGGRVIPRCEP